MLCFVGFESGETCAEDDCGGFSDILGRKSCIFECFEGGMDGELGGAVHFSGGDAVIDIDAGFVEFEDFAADVDFHIFCVMDFQRIDTTLGSGEIFPECAAVISEAADSADARDENPLHA